MRALKILVVGTAIFLGLQVGHRLVVAYEFETKLMAKAQIEWSSTSDKIFEQTFIDHRGGPGRKLYQTELPSDVRALRINPISRQDEVRIFRITIGTSFGLPLKIWKNELLDWSPTSGLLFDQKAGVWKADSPQEYLSLSNVDNYRYILLGINLFLSVFLGMVLFGDKHFFKRYGLAGAFATVSLATILFLYSRASDSDSKVKPLGSYEDYAMTLIDGRGFPISNRPGKLKIQLDPFTFYRISPDQKTDHFTIDQFGFRGTSPWKNRPRAFVLGGSAIFGQGLSSDEQTLTHQLNNKSNYQFINAAVPGFLSGQELSLMTHYLDRFSPSLHIVINGFNDIWSKLDERPLDKNTVFGANSSMIQMIENQLREVVRRPATKTNNNLTDPQVLKMITETYINNIKKMHAAAKSQNARLMVFFQPEVYVRQKIEQKKVRMNVDGVEGDYDEKLSGLFRQLISATKKTCEELGIFCRDINEAPEFLNDKDKLFIGYGHLTPRGHEVLSDIIARSIKEAGETL